MTPFAEEGDEGGLEVGGVGVAADDVLELDRAAREQQLAVGEDGSLTVDPDVFVPYSGERPHQVRLSGGDASSDSYCFPDQ